MAIDASISEVPGLERAAYLTLTGTFDLRSADNFDAFWRKLVRVERKRLFILDVSGISDCTPVAVQVLRDFCDAAVQESHGCVAMVNPSPAVLMLIKEMDLVAAFTLFVDYKLAFEHLRAVAHRASAIDQQRKDAERAEQQAAEASASRIVVPPAVQPGLPNAGIAALYTKPPDGSPVDMDVTRVHIPPSARRPSGLATDTGSVSGPNFVPPQIPAANAGEGGGFRLRAFDAQGTLHTTDTSVQIQPGRRVLVLIGPGNDHARKMFCDAVDRAGFTPLLLFPLPEGHGFNHVANAVTQAEMVLADFAPARVRVLDPNADVLTTLTLVRAIMGPERILIMTPNRLVPDLWKDVIFEQYNENRAQLRKAVPVIVDRLRRMAVSLAGGAGVQQ